VRLNKGLKAGELCVVLLCLLDGTAVATCCGIVTLVLKHIRNLLAAWETKGEEDFWRDEFVVHHLLTKAGAQDGSNLVHHEVRTAYANFLALGCIWPLLENAEGDLADVFSSDTRHL